MIELRGYIDEKGNKPFANWLETLDATAAAKVTIALTRIEQGNLSKTKGVGAGVYPATAFTSAGMANEL
jgi:putative component of toxin-antitoxin plasmid stabilization module